MKFLLLSLCLNVYNFAPEGEGLVGWEEEGWGLRSGLLGEMSVSLLCQGSRVTGGDYGLETR